LAYNNGLTPKQAEGVYNQFNQGVSALSESKTKELEERSNKALSISKQTITILIVPCLLKLVTLCVLRSTQLVKDMGFDDSKVEAISAQLGVQDTIKLFSRVGKAGSEPSFVGGERSANTQSIDEQIQEIYNNPDYLIPLCLQVGKSLITSFFKLFSFRFTKCRHTFIKLIINPLCLLRCKSIIISHISKQNEQKMDQAKTGFRDMGFDDSKVEAISAQLGVQDTIKLFKFSIN
jgi:hypothetical protein